MNAETSSGFDPASVHEGDELASLIVHVRRSDLVRYAGASTDFNPIHYSDRHARAVGQDGVIAHGMWTMGTALRVVTDWCGDPARVRSCRVRFARPVPVPDTDEGTEVRFGGVVTKIADAVATVQLKAMCGESSVLAAARAEVRLD